MNMTHYTPSHIKEIKKAKALSNGERKTYLQMLAAKWKKTYSGVYNKYISTLSVKQNKPRRVFKQKVPIVRNGVIEVPFVRMNIDIKKKTVIFSLE